MKKNYFVLLFCLVFSVSLFAQKSVLYVTSDKTMDATATFTDEDPIIQVLNADANITLTVALNDGTQAIDFTGYDAAIIQEGFGSGSAILKPAAAAGLDIIPVPFIYNKVYGLRAGKGLTTSPGVANESTSLSFTPEASQTGNDIFKGCTLTGSDIAVFVSGAADDGSVGTKSLNYTTLNVLSAGVLLAQPTGVTDAVVAVNDIPAGTTIDSETLLSRMIAISMNFGAISANGGTNITDNGLTMWRNAVYMLTGLAVPSTAATLPTAVEAASVSADVVAVEYYNINGVQVDAPTQGIFIKKTILSNGAVESTKVVF